jgi:rSAM/selenodomain-associated transferase 1
MDRAKSFDGEATSAHVAPAARSSADTTSLTSAAGCGIAVMAKASTPGLTKTRLVPPLTYDAAASLNTAFLQDVTDNMLLAASRAAPHAAIAGYAAYGPPGSEEFFRRNFPASIGLIAAWLPNFGDCLFHTICQIFARGHAAAVVLNADSPTLPTALLNETAEMLARPGDRAVLGPSSDGGYYLLGLKAAHRRMFNDIAWSTARVAEQTRERAREIGLDLHLLPEWYDVDDVETLRRLHAELHANEPTARQPAAGAPHRGRHSASLLNRLWPHGDFSRPVEGSMEIEKASV